MQSGKTVVGGGWGGGVQSVMYLLTQVGRKGRSLGGTGGCAADQTRADNEEVNKRNGTWKCSPNKAGPTIESVINNLASLQDGIS